MNYRKFKAADMDVSLLGFGAMRLPILDDDAAKIDEAESIKMIRYAIDSGVNYIDTAYVYHMTQGEILVGKALEDGYRDKVFVATKMAYWRLNSPDEMQWMLDTQLEKLQTDHIDMYLVHDVNSNKWGQIIDWKIWDFLERQREAGKIRFIGFSFHGESPEEFKMVLDTYPWDFVQLQMNYMDKDIQAGMEGFEYAVSKGVPVIVMEPLKGGKLAEVINPNIQNYWDSLRSDRTPAEWAMRWAANLPGVLTILSGMGTMEQVEENIRVLSDADEGMLSEAELKIIEKVAEEYRNQIVYHCTGCKYCLPCPENLNIPVLINFRNAFELYGNAEKMKSAEYGFLVKIPPSTCTACGKCESECPQHIEIIRALKETSEIFE